MITKKEIEKEALANSVKVFQVKDPRQYGEYSHERFIDGATWAQSKILEMASNGFEAFSTNYRSSGCIKDHMENSWQAAKLSSAEEIEKLKDHVKYHHELRLKELAIIQNLYTKIDTIQKERDELILRNKQLMEAFEVITKNLARK